MSLHLFTATNWSVFLEDESTTCNIDFSMKGSLGVNVKEAFKSDSFVNCERTVTGLEKTHQDVGYFLWASTPYTITKNISANCIAFKECNKEDRVTLKETEITYRSDKCKFLRKLSKC